MIKVTYHKRKSLLDHKEHHEQMRRQMRIVYLADRMIFLTCKKASQINEKFHKETELFISSVCYTLSYDQQLHD